MLPLGRPEKALISRRSTRRYDSNLEIDRGTPGYGSLKHNQGRLAGHYVRYTVADDPTQPSAAWLGCGHSYAAYDVLSSGDNGDVPWTTNCAATGVTGVEVQQPCRERGRHGGATVGTAASEVPRSCLARVQRL